MKLAHRICVALAALMSSTGCGDALLDPGVGGGGLAYVVTSDPYRLVVLETDTQREVTQISLTPVPRGVAVTPDGSHVYVTTLPNTVQVMSATCATALFRSLKPLRSGASQESSLGAPTQ